MYRVYMVTAGTNPPLAPASELRQRRHLLAAVTPALTKKQRIRRQARRSLSFAGTMHYTMTAQRAELFHRARGAFRGAHADCSQYSASLCHWVGVSNVTDTDWTGTLGKKGRRIENPTRGGFVFFGYPPYVHMGVLVRPLLSRKWLVIAFGHNGAPDINSLNGLLAYFAGRGHTGHAFRDLTR